MKKFIFIMLCFLLLLLCSCGSMDLEASPTHEPTRKPTATSSPTPTPDPFNSWDKVEIEFPVVTYDDIKAGNYNEEYVIIDAFVESAETVTSSMSSLECWYASESYGYVIDHETISWDNVVTEKVEIPNHSMVRFCTKINKDSSFGMISAKAIKVIDSDLTMDKIETKYMESCASVSHDDVLRNPDKYKYCNLSFSGSVFQLVSEKENELELMLECGSDQYVFIHYTKPDGKPRILEGDLITVYGVFYKLYSYTSMLGTKQTIPELYVYFMK